MARRADAGDTVIANLDGAGHATVDRAGRVTPTPGGWTLEWWVRSAERWHQPAEARSVTQRLVDGAPVVETSMRIPDGYAVHRSWCARQGGRDWAVVEVENASSAPVAVALALRPSGGGRTGRLDVDGDTVVIDGRPSLALSRRPSRFVAAPEGDVAGIVMADGGDERWSGPLTGADPEAAFVFPLAHTARLRVAVALDGPDRARGELKTPDLASLPDATRVASGWRAHTEPAGSLRLDLPDDRVGDAVRACRATLLLGLDRLDPGAAMPALAALDRHGLLEPVGRVLAGHPGRARLDGSFRGPVRVDVTAAAVWSLGDHWRLARDAGFAEAAMGAAAKGAHRLARRRARAAAGALGPAAQLAAGDLLDGAGQPEAAARCRELAGRDGSPEPLVAPWPAPTPAALLERLDRATSTWTWPGEDAIEAAAALLLAVRDLVVREAPGSVPGLALAWAWPDDWLGQGFEVHGAPTWWGRLSYAVRWHGARPALLWELVAHPGVDGPVELTAPGLDPSWSSTEPRGEALLAPVEPAGGLPGVVRPLAPGGHPAASAPEGGTFS